MSKRPVELSTGSLIFKQLQARGFAITPWLIDPSNADKKRIMFETLTQLIIDGQLRPPHTKHVPVSDYRSAIDRAIDGVNEKQLLIFDAVNAKI
jgi:NADPH:quinone reductase-like Zn-dependent oxidoreductase